MVVKASEIDPEIKQEDGASSRRSDLEKLRGQLLIERSTFLSHWNDLGRFFLPRRPRFVTTDVDRGNRRNNSIINSTGGLAARTMRAGMMSGITSPARPWFRMTTTDPDLAEYEPVKNWLYTVTLLMFDVFGRSNLYNSCPTVYGDMGVFATAAMHVEEDFQHVIRTYPYPIGSYCLIADSRMKIKGFMRDFRYTVRQIVEKWGRVPGQSNIDWTNISSMVKDLWGNGNTEAWIELSHVVVENPDWDAQKLGSKYKRFRSTYWERGALIGGGMQEAIGSGKFLSDRGYDFFPVLCPRWEITGEDIYGTYCPGMEALGDTMQLQMMERRGMQALEKSINPPMVGPASLRSQKATVLPGDITYLDVREGQQGFAPAYQINPNFQQLENKQKQIEQRINSAFFADLFLMLENLERSNITAEEIRERKEEKLLALGPVLEQLNQDFLDPLVEITFNIMMRQRRLPPPPPALRGHILKPEYTSIMAQAQKLLGISSMERFSGFVGGIVTQTKDPTVLDKVDVDELIDKYGDMTSIPPGIIRDKDQVAQIRQKRQQAQEQQAKMEQINQAAQAAGHLANADMSGDNALTRLTDEANAGNIVPQR